MSIDIVTEMQNEGARQRRNAAAIRKATPREPQAKKAKRGTPERDLQRAIVTLARRAFPQVLLAAIPNEQAGASGDANARARFGAARKASGVLSGFPDLIACLPGGRVLFLELKAPKGTTSAAQDLVHARLYDMGHPVSVIRSVDEAAALLRKVLA